MIDVVIIGAGVVGCLTARALSRYQVDILLLDKADDVAEGSTKANSGIVHAGYDAKPNSYRAKLNISGNAMMKTLVQELSVEYANTGSMVIAFDESQLMHLKTLYDRGIQNGVPNMQLITCKEKLRELEPALSSQVIGALYAPTAGIICPWGLAIAACENAVSNGAKLMLETKVLRIEKQPDRFIIHTNKGRYETRYIINAAGAHADEISAMAEEKWFSIKPKRGEYLLLDKKVARLASKTLFGTPGPMGKGILVSPTVHGNLLLGPTSVEQLDKEDTDTTAEGMDSIFEKARNYIPALNRRDVIATYTGIRATPDKDDFIIGASEQVHGFIHAAGIDSPGLTASPAIAQMLLEILSEEGLKLIPKADYIPGRKSVIQFARLSEAEKVLMIQNNPLYGNVVCRCEVVTEGEIVDAIRRPAGARNLDGIKRRIRGGAGRCQGGFCGPRTIDILARELGIAPEMVTKKGGNSFILSEKRKTAAREERHEG